MDGLYGQALRSCPLIFVAGIVMGFVLGGRTGKILAIVFCSLGLLLFAGCLAGRRVLRRQMAERSRE